MRASLAHEHVAMDHGDHHPPSRRPRGGVGDQDVAVLDAALSQGIALDPDRVAVRPTQVEDLRQVDRAFQAVAGRADEPRGVAAVVVAGHCYAASERGARGRGGIKPDAISARPPALPSVSTWRNGAARPRA